MFDHLLYNKDYDKGYNKHLDGNVYGKSTREGMPSLGISCHSPSNSPCSPAGMLSKPHNIGIFIEASSYR